MVIRDQRPKALDDRPRLQDGDRGRRPLHRHALTYGWPSAAGGTARPTAPATTTIVSTYGSKPTIWNGTLMPCSCIAVGMASATPNSSAAPHAPNGVHLPKIIAASAMNPRPLVISRSKWGTDSSVKYAPPSPASAPPRTTLK